MQYPHKWRPSVSLDCEYREMLGGGSYEEFSGLFGLASDATPNDVRLDDPELHTTALEKRRGDGDRFIGDGIRGDIDG